MSYTNEWKEAERLVGRILLSHAHGYGEQAWSPSDNDVLRAIISFAALGVPGCTTALKAERTAVYEKMRDSAIAFMEQHGDDPVAILCNKRDLEIAEAPYGMAVVGVDPGWDGPKQFMFQGTPAKTWNVLFDDKLQIKAVGQLELEHAHHRG